MMQIILFSAERAAANHLWQSTLFLLCATLLNLALRRNHARIRSLLWLGASIKFLIPFSLLTALGSHLASLHHPAKAPAFYFVFEKVSRPFTHSATGSSLFSLLPWFVPILALIWIIGSAVVMVRCCLRWRRVLSIQRSATFVTRGREVEALRRIENAVGIRQPIAVCFSSSPLEPGVFGIVRPVLLWPEKISQHLADAPLEAVLAHEVEHVRRWDNLTAAVHMLVEATFWFHPLVWWLGARMVEERERACDEAVIERGSAPQTYAEGILAVCKFSLASPLLCVSGVTGGELSQRIMRIMSPRTATRLGLTQKFALVAIGLGTVAAPVFIGLVRTPFADAQSSSTGSTAKAGDAVAIPVPGASLGTIQIYRVGGGVSAPKLVYAPDPEYTKKAQKANYQGVCVIALIVDTEGKPERVHVLRHLGMGLDQKAVEAVKQYKFTPALLQGKPVPVQVNIEVNFRVN